MTEQELNRAIQYVTASTSYGRETVAEILRTGFDEMHAMADTTASRFNREDLVGYICQWTMKRTGHPEPLVREVLDGAGRWLDEVSRLVAARQMSSKQSPEARSQGRGPSRWSDGRDRKRNAPFQKVQADSFPDGRGSCRPATAQVFTQAKTGR